MALAHLFKPLQVGDVCLPNRIIMAPMTRYRCTATGEATSVVVEHFAQRASAGLIICEGGYVHPSGRLAVEAGGIVTPAQIASWRRVTDAVHAAGGRIFMQLMHGGRVSHRALQEDGGAAWAPSAVLARNDTVRSEPGIYTPAEPPRAISKAEIAELVEAYGRATQNAADAGFDGVELHAGNGYLPHQFLASNTNLRTDSYGGSPLNRARFLLEALDEMRNVKGGAFVGLKISPVTTHHDTHDADPYGTYHVLLRELKAYRDVAYLTVQTTMNFVQPGDPPFDVFLFARQRWDGVLFAAGNLDRYSGEGLISSRQADAAVYGRRFVANADLVRRFKEGLQENLVDWERLVSIDAAGYNDYPLAT